MKSVVINEKPITRVSLPDWHGKVWEVRQTCDTRRRDAFNVRNESRQLRNETDSKTKWNTYINNVYLQDRFSEVTKWRDILVICSNNIEKETNDMISEKRLTEIELENLDLSFTVVNQCLTQRDKRGGSDLCRDNAEDELKHELATLEALKKMLTDKCLAAADQINKLEEVKFLLTTDINDKNDTLEIERYNLGLDENCANTSYKPDPLRNPKEIIPHDGWLEHCHFLKLKAENELDTSQKLRESMYVPRERARNDLKAQNDATNFALRKRIYETQRIKNEIEWQRLNLVSDMERLNNEIGRLNTALLNKTNALKLAETRCENRLYRTGAELCRDKPMEGLIDEVNDLHLTRKQIQEKMDQAKSTYNALEFQLISVDGDLEKKNQALMTDLMCLSLRDQLIIGGSSKKMSQTDRNVVLTRMQDEIPPE